MKKSRIFGALSAIAILLSAASLAGQTPWNQIALANPAAKILAPAHAPRFTVRLTAAFPLGSPAAQSVDFQNLQTAAYAPGTVEQLFGQLGGPFFIGQFSTQQTTPYATLQGHSRPLPGLALGYRLSPRFELSAGVQRFRSDWSGEFPVVVLPPPNPHQEQAPPRTETGDLEASASGTVLDFGLSFLLPGRVVQPFVEGGVRGIFPGQNNVSASLAGVVLPLKAEPAATEFSPFGGAGLRVGFCKNGFAETRFSCGKMGGGKFGGQAALGVGWRF